MSTNNLAPPQKPLATPNIAHNLGKWAAHEGITTIVVFGMDVVFAIHRNGDQVVIPRQFNDVVWGMNMLKAAQAAFKTANTPLGRQADLVITFEADILPGDPGFELPESLGNEVPVETPPLSVGG